MRVKTTLSRNEETQEKELSFPNWAYIAVRDAAQSSNKDFTQGKVVYEILHFDPDKPVFDSLTQVEDDLNDRIRSDVTHSFLENLRKIKISPDVGGERVDVRESLLNDVPDDLDAEATMENAAKIRLPKTTWRQIPKSRYIATYIAPSVEYFAASPFDSRMERMRFKREILAYVCEDETPSHPVARAVCLNGESDRLSGVQEAHDDLMRAVGREWDAETISKSDLENWSDEQLKAKKLTGHRKPECMQALEAAIDNDGLEPDREKMREYISECFNVGTSATIDTYLEHAKMSWRGNVELVDVEETAEKAVNEAIEEIEWYDEEDEELARSYDVVEVLRTDVTEAAGYYEDAESGVNALSEVFEDVDTADDVVVSTRERNKHDELKSIDKNLSRRARNQFEKEISKLELEADFFNGETLEVPNGLRLIAH